MPQIELSRGERIINKILLDLYSEFVYKQRDQAKWEAGSEMMDAVFDAWRGRPVRLSSLPVNWQPGRGRSNGA